MSPFFFFHFSCFFNNFFVFCVLCFVHSFLRVRKNLNKIKWNKKHVLNMLTAKLLLVFFETGVFFFNYSVVTIGKKSPRCTKDWFFKLPKIFISSQLRSNNWIYIYIYLYIYLLKKNQKQKGEKGKFILIKEEYLCQVSFPSASSFILLLKPFQHLRTIDTALFDSWITEIDI